MADDPIDDATPKCPRCLIALEVEGRGAFARWYCPSCDYVRL